MIYGKEAYFIPTGGGAIVLSIPDYEKYQSGGVLCDLELVSKTTWNAAGMVKLQISEELIELSGSASHFAEG